MSRGEVLAFIVSMVIIVFYGCMCYWLGMIAERKKPK